MHEVEVKILEIHTPTIIRTIESLGGEKIQDEDIYGYFFHNGTHRLRLRKMVSGNVLTFKQRISDIDVKQAIEYETQVGNFDAMRAILESTGYTLYRTSKKHRIGYQLGNIIFDIDQVDGIPDFIEVESDNIETVHSGVELLGYQMTDTCTLSETGLYQHYGIYVPNGKTDTTA